VSRAVRRRIARSRHKTGLERAARAAQATRPEVAERIRRRQCGPCQACCEVMSVEQLKPAYSRCPHQCAKGCAIYAARPSLCRHFSCLWRAGFGGEEDRPDETGAVLTADASNPPGWIVVRVSRPFDVARVLEACLAAANDIPAVRFGVAGPWHGDGDPIPFAADVRSLAGLLVEASARLTAPNDA
jgi:hypothetical protein